MFMFTMLMFHVTKIMKIIIYSNFSHLPTGNVQSWTTAVRHLLSAQTPWVTDPTNELFLIRTCSPFQMRIKKIQKRETDSNHYYFHTSTHVTIRFIRQWLSDCLFSFRRVERCGKDGVIAIQLIFARDHLQA